MIFKPYYRLKVHIYVCLHIPLDHLRLPSHSDTVVGDFLDSYENLTLKAVMGYRWAADNCKQVRAGAWDVILFAETIFVDMSVLSVSLP